MTALNQIDPWFAIFCNRRANSNEVETIKIALTSTLRDPQVIEALRANGVHVTKKSTLPSEFLINEYTKYQKITQKLDLQRD